MSTELTISVAEYLQCFVEEDCHCPACAGSRDALRAVGMLPPVITYEMLAIQQPHVV